MATAPDQAVKNEIDAQSGRFEFLKQALTLGLAGVAGMAALFTDGSKLPTSALAIVTASLSGLFLLCVVGAALMGISTYANLLKGLSAGGNIERFRNSMIQHARWVFGSIALAAVAITAYAATQIGRAPGTPEITPGAALATAWTALSSQGCSVHLESLATTRDNHAIAYRSDQCARRYIVNVSTAENRIDSITSRPITPPTPATGSAAATSVTHRCCHHRPRCHRAEGVGR